MHDFTINITFVKILTEQICNVRFSARLLGCGLVLFISGYGSGVKAASLDVLLECSATANSEREIDACLSIVLEQSETALSDIEQSWQRLLESRPDTPTDLETKPLAAAGADVQSDDNSASKVIAIVNDTALESGAPVRGEILNVDEDENSKPLVNQSVDIKERFGFIPALFRSYRDQHCAWEATVFSADRVDVYFKACVTRLNRDRVSVLSQSLAEMRSINKGGRNLKGYYVRTNSGATFQACDRKTDWWVTASDAVLASLERRYADMSTRNISSVSSSLVYAELLGTLESAPSEGPGADYQAALRVKKINLFRPISERDCAAVQSVPVESSAVVDTPQAATVDDYASAGFLYGYFNYWLSACSVTENSVCSAESEAQFASDGDWKLRVDRSLEGDWRVQLIPTTDNEVIEKELKLQIDRADVYLATSFPEPMNLTLRQGVDIAVGEVARELIVRLRDGGEIRFEWLDESGVMSELKFSLLGVTRALQFFDQAIR